MLAKILSRRTLLIVGLTGFALAAAFIFYLAPNSTPKAPLRNRPAPLIKKTVVLPKPAPASYGSPVRLKIPKIDVEAAIEQVGLERDGAMGAPKGPAEAGWLNLGPRPGETGSAVIDGHSGWKNGIPAVFDNLTKIEPGDKIVVQDDNGADISFVVRASRSYAPNADASEVFASHDGKAHLNLITCSGVWDKVARSHSERLVVFTDKE